MTQSTGTKRKAAQRATALLAEDHKTVRKLFKEFEKLKEDGGGQDKEALVQQICMELSIHARIEEEIFYPALRQAIEDGDLMEEAAEEHASAKVIIEDLKRMKPGDEHYDAKVSVLMEYVEHHIKEEQGEIFPKAKKADLDTPELGAQLMERKQELMADPALLEKPTAAGAHLHKRPAAGSHAHR